MRGVSCSVKSFDDRLRTKSWSMKSQSRRESRLMYVSISAKVAAELRSSLRVARREDWKVLEKPI